MMKLNAKYDGVYCNMENNKENQTEGFFVIENNPEITDYTGILQQTFNENERIYISSGTYEVSETLLVPSNRYIKASPDARIKYIAKRNMNRYDFLLSNSDTVIGNEDITIEGGIWDGGNYAPYNRKRHDLFSVTGCCGACINFVGVKNLTLKGMEITNTIAFYIRMSRIMNFRISDITFSGEKLTSNQDGIHMGGDVFNGLIENIRSATYGQTGDDLLAFNADDSVIRHDNRGLTCGPIGNITVNNVYAECCHCAVRFCSVVSPIYNIRITNLEAGCKNGGINADAARYCRTPLFPEREAPEGVGCLENIVIDGFTFNYVNETDNPVFVLESHADKFEIINYNRRRDIDKAPSAPDFRAKNLTRQIITKGEERHILTKKDEVFSCSGFDGIRLDYAYEEK